MFFPVNIRDLICAWPKFLKVLLEKFMFSTFENKFLLQLKITTVFFFPKSTIILKRLDEAGHK